MSWLKTCLLCLFALYGALDAPAHPLGDVRRMRDALAGLKAQRAGVVDAYVVVAALDSDPVFGREAREAGRVLASRFDAGGRTVVLAHDEGNDRADAPATPESLASALGGVANVMNRDEDVLVLYTTSHGSPRAGLNFRDPTRGAAVIAPAQLAAMLDRPGFKNRLIILQACFSGQFVDALAAPRTVVATASSSMKSSFGCSAGNDWTFFGYALINQAMRQPDTFVRQFRRAFVTILGWEQKSGFEPSSPQISVGSEAASWLAALDAREPKRPTAPVGQLPSEIAH
jgi:Peptidase C13 family